MARRSIEKAEERIQQRIASEERVLEGLQKRVVEAERKVEEQRAFINGIKSGLDDVLAAPEEKGDES